MGAGGKTEQVTFQQPVATADAALGRAVVPTTVATVWAEVTESSAPEQASETLQQMQVTAVLAHVVKVWYRADLAVADPSWQIVWGSRTLQVARVSDPGQRHQELWFACREVQA